MDPIEEELVTEQVNVQHGAEAYAGLYEKPADPWDDPITWARVKVAPQFVVPQSAIAGLNQAAVFSLMSLITEGEPVLDGYIWTGIAEKPGFTLCHAHKRFAWLMIMDDDAFSSAVATGAVVHYKDT